MQTQKQNFISFGFNIDHKRIGIIHNTYRTHAGLFYYTVHYFQCIITNSDAAQEQGSQQ